jgi:hypothetical protein
MNILDAIWEEKTYISKRVLVFFYDFYKSSSFESTLMLKKYENFKLFSFKSLSLNYKEQKNQSC